MTEKLTINIQGKTLEAFYNQYGEAWFSQKTAKEIGPIVKAWMRTQLTEHVELETGEIDLTGLGEAAADYFQISMANGDIPTPVFDWAFEAAYPGEVY